MHAVGIRLQYTQHSKHSNILAYSNISYVGGCKHEVESKKEKKYCLWRERERERERDFCLCVMDWLCVVPSQRSWWLSRLKADWHIHEDPIHLIPPRSPHQHALFPLFLFHTLFSYHLSVYVIDLNCRFEGNLYCGRVD